MLLAVMHMISYRVNRVKGHRVNRVKGHGAHAVVHTGPEVED